VTADVLGNVVLEWDGEVQLGQSCEKWNITKSQEKKLILHTTKRIHELVTLIYHDGAPMLHRW